MLVLGDSELIIGFVNRKYKPSKKFYNRIVDIKRLCKSLCVPIKFRHVFRENNQLADWLANVAKHLSHSCDLTPHLTTHHTTLTFLSPPPWPSKEAPEQLHMQR